MKSLTLLTGIPGHLVSEGKTAAVLESRWWQTLETRAGGTLFLKAIQNTEKCFQMRTVAVNHGLQH